MENLYIVLIKFIPVLVLLLIGVLTRKTKLLKSDTIQGLKTLVIYVTLPSLLFLTFAKTTLEPRYILVILSVLFVCIIMLLLGTRFSKKLCPGNKYYPSVFSSYEAGMLGFALFTAFFGTENTYKFAIVDLGQELFVFFILLSFLQKQKGSDINAKQLVLGFIKSPEVLAIAAGIIFSITGLSAYLKGFQITDSFVGVLTQLGSLTAPLICIAIGYELNIDKNNIVKPFLTALIRMSLMVAFGLLLNEFLFVRFLKLDSGFGTALFTMYLLPPSFIIPIFIDQDAEKERKPILSMISINIVLTLIALLILVSVTA